MKVSSKPQGTGAGIPFTKKICATVATSKPFMSIKQPNGGLDICPVTL